MHREKMCHQFSTDKDTQPLFICVEGNRRHKKSMASTEIFCWPDIEGKDLCELRRHIYGNGVDRVTLKRFLARVFKSCRCKEIYEKTHGKVPLSDPSPEEQALHSNQSDTPTDDICGSHERALSIQETVQMMDMREEGITTLLSYLELHPENWVASMNHVYARCSMKCYKGARQLMSVAKKCPPVAVVIAKQKLEGKSFSDCSNLDFDVIDVCDSMGWDSGTVKRELLSLQWESGPNGVHKTGVCVELSDLAFHFRSRGDLTDNQMDRVLDFLYHRTQQQEKTELRQLNLLSQALMSISHKNYWMCSDDVDVERSDRLKEMLRKYFDGEDGDMDVEETALSLPEASPSILAQLSGDIRQFVSLYRHDHSLTGRAVARVFHGIESPNFPAKTWGRVRRFWRQYLDVDFYLIIKEATQILMAMK